MTTITLGYERQIRSPEPCSSLESAWGRVLVFRPSRNPDETIQLGPVTQFRRQVSITDNALPSSRRGQERVGTCSHIMATGGADTATSPRAIVQPLHRGAPTPAPLSTASPPSKRELASWWKKFRKTTEKSEEKGE